MEILREHTQKAIKNAMESNILQFMKVNILPEDEVLETSEMFRWYCGDDILLRNWVLNPKFTPENAETKVREQMEYFRRRQVTFLWWNGPSAEPANLGEIMEQAGMIKIELPPDSGDMVLDLRILNDKEKVYESIVKKIGLEIHSIQSQKHIRDAVDIFIKTGGHSENFREPGENSCEIMLQEDPSINKVVGYIAYLENKPVAVSSVFYGGGVAGIYNVGTLKKFRNRGIGTAITLAPLIDARKRGYEIAVLTATTLGFPIYKRIGFKKMPMLDQYFWSPQPFRRFLYKMYFHWQLRKVRKKKLKS